MSQLRVHALRHVRRQPFNGVVADDVVGPAFELAVADELLANVLPRFFMFGEQPFMSGMTWSALAKRFGLQEPVHLLLQTFVVLEGVVAVRRLATQDFRQIRPSRVARRPVVGIAPPDFPSRSAVDVGVRICCAIDIESPLRVPVPQQMVESPSLQFSPLHRRASPFVLDLEI